MSETPSITKQPVFRPKLNREISLEDLNTAKLAFFDSLSRQGYEMDVENENAFWDSMGLFLEESFGWPDYVGFN